MRTRNIEILNLCILITIKTEAGIMKAAATYINWLQQATSSS
jgi:hypothetical protein